MTSESHETNCPAGTNHWQLYLRKQKPNPPNDGLISGKVSLKKGEKEEVLFTLDEEDPGFYHNDYSFYAEDDEFRIMVGTSSENYLAQDIDIKFYADKTWMTSIH